MRRFPWSTVLFATSLIALVALGVWWTVFLARSVELERSAHRAELLHRAQMTALRLGHIGDEEDVELRVGLVEGEPDLEIVPDGEDELSWPLIPARPELGVRVRGESLTAIEERLTRRRVMVIGESALLFLLLAVCLVMLYRLTVQERAHRRRMEEFVSAFTHEMKTPLAGLVSLLQTLAAGRIPEGRQRELVELGLQQVDRLDHSIGNVLLSGRLRSERFELRLDEVSLRPLLEAVRGHHENVGCQVALEEMERIDDLMVRADDIALRIILNNLVDNGLRYGPDRTVKVIVRRRESWVDIDIIDRGDGLPRQPDELERLFQPFERGEGQNERRPGTGLGLYISRTLARRMGGDVFASHDSPEAGSVLRVTLEAVDMGR